MTFLNDNYNNTEPLFVYIDYFKWKHPLNVEAFKGHPKSKEVYFVIRNKDTKSYRLVYETLNGVPQALLIDSINTDEDHPEYVIKSSVIDKTTVLNYEIKEEDLDKMLQWQRDEEKLHASNSKEQSPQITGDQTRQLKNKAIVRTMDEKESAETFEFVEKMLRLKESSPLMFEAIDVLVDHITEYENEEETSLDTNWVKLSPRFGAGVNVSKAMEHLSTYLSENRRTNLEEYDLLEAIKHLLNEINRRVFNESR